MIVSTRAMLIVIAITIIAFPSRSPMLDKERRVCFGFCRWFGRLVRYKPAGVMVKGFASDSWKQRHAQYDVAASRTW